MGELFWLTGKAFLISLILTPIVRDIFRAYNIVDRPAQRKVHAYPIPRVGGIAIAAGYMAAMLGAGTPGGIAHNSPVLHLLPGALVVFLTGLIDDFFQLRPVTKLLGMLAAAILVFNAGVRIDSVAGVALSPWLAAPITIFWLLLTSNALNLIDGLDGLCAGMGMLATLTLFGASLLHGNPALAFATLPMAGALLGFLCFNLNPATVFLGDSGALLIGFLLGCYGIVWTQKTATLISVIVPLLALSIPLLEVSLSVLRRFLTNQPLFGADRGHIHHRLLDRGLTAKQAVWVLYLFATLTAAVTLLATSYTRYQAIATAIFAVAAFVGIRQLRYLEFDVVGRMLFRGGLHRAVGAKMRMAQIVTALDRARDDETWWNALVHLAPMMGLTAIELSGPQRRKWRLLDEAEGPEWEFHVPLNDGQFLALHGSCLVQEAACDLVAVSAVIRNTQPLARKRAAAEALAARAEG